jgi:hypothetical protein
MKSPVGAVKEAFGDKAKLVAELEKLAKTDGDDLWVSRLNAKKGLVHVSNAKLLRLHRTFTAVKEKFGTRAKLIDAIAEIEKRAKDEGYKTRLGAYPVPRLWDMYQSVSKRLGAPERAAAKKAGAKTPKAVAKKTAAAAAAAKPKKKAAAAPKKKAASKKKKKS